MDFTRFNFHPELCAGIAACQYTTPTPIQEKTIPPILKGRDVLGLAQTGTGKTAAFALPMLQRFLGRKSTTARGLIMAPTRELAEQIHDNIQKMGRHTGLKSVTVYGGVGKNPQIKAFRRGVDIVVACPGRLLDLVNTGAADLSGIEMLVLDEADQMLDMGFLPDIKRIIRQLPQKRQSLVFSATMPAEIARLTRSILHRPETVRINPSSSLPAISHSVFKVSKQGRTSLLKALFQDDGMASTLVFTRTKHKAKSLAAQLAKAGFSAASLQGNLSQNKRRQTMDGFRDGRFDILVATDIAARGIDVSGVSHVVNYDLPDTVDTYIHRTGRTGRAKKSGRAYTFAAQEDMKMVARIEKTLGRKMEAVS